MYLRIFEEFPDLVQTLDTSSLSGLKEPYIWNELLEGDEFAQKVAGNIQATASEKEKAQ